MRRSTSPRSSETRSSMSTIGWIMLSPPSPSRQDRFDDMRAGLGPHRARSGGWRLRSSPDVGCAALEKLPRERGQRAPKQVEELPEIGLLRIDVLRHEGA